MEEDAGLGLRMFGWIMFALGLALIAISSFGMDPTVRAPGSFGIGTDEVANMLKMHARELMHIGGAALMVSGAVVAAAGHISAALKGAARDIKGQKKAEPDVAEPRIEVI